MLDALLAHHGRSVPFDMRLDETIKSPRTQRDNSCRSFFSAFEPGIAIARLENACGFSAFLIRWKLSCASVAILKKFELSFITASLLRRLFDIRPRVLVSAFLAKFLVFVARVVRMRWLLPPSQRLKCRPAAKKVAEW